MNLNNVYKPIKTDRFRKSNGSVSALNLHITANITETKDLKHTIPNDEEKFRGQADIFSHTTLQLQSLSRPFTPKCLN